MEMAKKLNYEKRNIKYISNEKRNVQKTCCLHVKRKIKIYNTDEEYKRIKNSCDIAQFKTSYRKE